MKPFYFVPEDLIKQPNWVLWKKVMTEDGRSTKIPYNAHTGGKASTTKESTWCDYNRAYDTFKAKPEVYSGVGFVFTKQLGVTFIDLDHCFQDNGDLTPFAQNVYDNFEDTFIEVSQSGKGLHIFAKGSIPKALKKDVVELYDNGRYVAFTGQTLNGCQIVDKSNQIDTIYQKYTTKPIEIKKQVNSQLTLSENEIIEKIQNSKQSKDFYYYYNGGAEANSENTLALASILTFWCNRDKDLIKSIMYKSALFREKFSRPTAGSTWLDNIINKTIATVGDVYDPYSNKEFKNTQYQEIEVQKLDFELNNVQLYYKFNNYGYETKSKERILTGISSLDFLMKGYELGCITLWTSATNGGKTTMMTKIVKETIKQGEKVFMFNGEQSKEDFKNNLYKQTVDKSQIFDVKYKDTNIYDYYVKEDALEELKDIYGENILIYDNNRPRDINTLLIAMNEVADLYNVKMFVLDNLMQVEIPGKNVNLEQSDIMEKLRTFSINKNVHINLVAHPRKGNENLIRSTVFDVAGSMNIANKAYNICSLIRKDHLDRTKKEYDALKNYLLHNRYDLEKCDGIIEVLKTKGECCGVVGLTYDKRRKTYQAAELISEQEKAIMLAELDDKRNKKRENKALPNLFTN